MSCTNRQILTLYKSLIRESNKIPAYNFRCYALRKVRDTFRMNKTLRAPDEVSNKIEEAKTSLELIKRQVLIEQLYTADKLVIEYTK